MKGEELVSIVMPAYNVEKIYRRINRKCFVSNIFKLGTYYCQ